MAEYWEKMLFGDGIATKTDVDIEERVKQADNPIRPATIRYWKAKEIYDRYQLKKPDRYKIRSRSEYEKEDLE